jgi:hypothetical protein
MRTLLIAVALTVAGAACGSAPSAKPAVSTTTTAAAIESYLPAGARSVEPGVWADDPHQLLIGTDCTRLDALHLVDGGEFGPYRNPNNAADWHAGYGTECVTP